MAVQWLDFHGQPAIGLQTPWGDRATVLLHGGQLLSWQTSNGTEHLYLSPKARLNGQDAVRGGIPICFPQFNQRGPLMKHGFARHLPWQLASVNADSLRLVLADGALTKRLWPYAFALELHILLSPNGLRVELRLDNTDEQAWAFTCALHTYLRVKDVQHTRLGGLDGTQVWDAVADTHGTHTGPVEFGVEFDRVFQARAGQQIRLIQSAPKAAAETGLAAQHMVITQSASCAQTVVWNPGEALGHSLVDMPAQGWREMLCVEAACIDAAVWLQPQTHWQAWQAFQWQP